MFSTAGLMNPAVFASDKNLFERTFGKLGQGSVRGAIFNLCNTAIGAGVLSLPYVLKQSGLIIGSLMIIIAGYFAILSLRLLIKKADEYEIFSYADLAFEAGGVFLAKLLQVSIIGFTYGIFISYQIIMGGLLLEFMEGMGMS